MWMTRKKGIKTSASVGIFKPRFHMCSIEVHKLVSRFNDAASAAVFRRLMMIKNGYARRNRQASRKRCHKFGWLVKATVLILQRTSHTCSISRPKLRLNLCRAQTLPECSVNACHHIVQKGKRHDPFCFDSTGTLFYLTTRITHHSSLGPSCWERKGGCP
jgi:hypothetical protein